MSLSLAILYQKASSNNKTLLKTFSLTVETNACSGSPMRISKLLIWNKKRSESFLPLLNCILFKNIFILSLKYNIYNFFYSHWFSFPFYPKWKKIFASISKDIGFKNVSVGKWICWRTVDSSVFPSWNTTRKFFSFFIQLLCCFKS
jgi:hypothetical protein